MSALVKRDEGSYITPDGDLWLRREFDGIYKWNAYRKNARGGYTQFDTARTLRDLRAQVGV